MNLSVRNARSEANVEICTELFFKVVSTTLKNGTFTFEVQKTAFRIRLVLNKPTNSYLQLTIEFASPILVFTKGLAFPTYLSNQSARLS